MSEPGADPMAVVKRFHDTYNASDWEGFRAVLDPGLHFEAPGHDGFRGDGPDALIRICEVMDAAIPGRTFSEAKRSAVSGDVVFYEGTWNGTPAEFIPGWEWKAGEPVVLRRNAIYVVRDGRVAEWLEYMG